MGILWTATETFVIFTEIAGIGIIYPIGILPVSSQANYQTVLIVGDYQKNIFVMKIAHKY